MHSSETFGNVILDLEPHRAAQKIPRARPLFLSGAHSWDKLHAVLTANSKYRGTLLCLFFFNKNFDSETIIIYMHL